jgi:hypothetical protein
MSGVVLLIEASEGKWVMRNALGKSAMCPAVLIGGEWRSPEDIETSKVSQVLQ